MVKKFLLSLLLFLLEISICKAAEAAVLENVRYSYGSGTVRVVLDVTSDVEFIESTAENPSRSVIDLRNTTVAASLHNYNEELTSTAAKRIRIAQFNKTTTRIVIETMAAIKIFKLSGGNSGHRVVIDVGNAEFKENPELNKPKEKEQKKKDDKKTKEEKKRKDDKKEDKKDDKKSKDKEQEKNDEPKIFDNDSKNLPGLKGKTIVIDPGHGGGDSGAIGPTGVMEKSVTLRVSLELEKLLKDEGVNVLMTRDTDKTVSPKGDSASAIEELQARCDVANKNGANVFVSIHADSFTNPDAKGSTGYYYGKSDSDDGRRLADLLRRGLCEQIQTPSRGTKPCNFYVVRHTDMPATLIELAFISNPAEEQILDSEEGIKKAALGLLNGLKEFFS